VFTSRDSVLTRPDGDPASSLTVCPGEHTMGAGPEAYSVVWWSPAPDVLPLDAQTPFGLRRDDLIVRDVPAAVTREYLDAYEAWRDGRARATAAARRPSVEVLTATAAAAGGMPGIEQFHVSVETAAGASGRPGGARFGTLVHALLADIPLGTGGEALLPALAEAQGRVLGASAEEVAAARASVGDVLRHPVLRAAAEAAAAGLCYRETPVTWRLETGAMIEGHVDLAYLAAGEFVVVDFKTDRELDDGALERYQRQVQIYAAAISAATSRPARAVLMRV
jgi:ATP-dependent exoDNAse (exonuclease V) beta subunit